MTNPNPQRPSGPNITSNGIWAMGLLLGLLVGLVPWAIGQFIPRGERANRNATNPALQQIGLNAPQNPATTATPASPVNNQNQPATPTAGGTNQTTNVEVIDPAPAVNPPVEREPSLAPRPIPARW
jgi:predicted lipid-binding transport protein (Tim44 family)